MRIALYIGKIIIISICKNILMKLVEILLDMSHKKKYNKLKCDFNIEILYFTFLISPFALFNQNNPLNQY